MDSFYEFLYSYGLMTRPLRCWCNYIGPVTITICCVVGFGYLLSKSNHNDFFPTRINNDPQLYNEAGPLLIGQDNRRSSISERIFNVLTDFMLAISGGVMKIKRSLTSGINNKKPQDRVMIQEDGSLFIRSWDRRSRIPRRTLLTNETSHNHFMNQGDEPLLVRSCERLCPRRRRLGRSR